MRDARFPVALLLAVALVASLLPPATGADETKLDEGIRKVREGDYEGAVPALEAALRQLERDGAPAARRAQACVYLGVAHVALDERDAAKARFREALSHDPALRLTPDRYSPKVIATFEEARSELAPPAAAPAAKEGGSKAPLVLLGAGAAAAGIAIAVSGDDNGSGGGGAPSFDGARFTTPVLVCPDGTIDAPLLVGIQLRGSNPDGQALTIRAVTAVLIIVESPAVPSEVGFASTAPAAATPSALGPGAQANLLVETTLLCANGEGDASRYNEWIGRLTLDTSAGVFGVETADRMRVNIP